jgi:hypothetical protein
MAESSFSGALEGARILIVEDESILAMDMEDRLKSEGWQLLGKRRGMIAAAFHVRRVHEPDLLREVAPFGGAESIGGLYVGGEFWRLTRFHVNIDKLDGTMSRLEGRCLQSCLVPAPVRRRRTPRLVAGGVFESLRHFLVFHSDFEHSLLGIRVLERLGFDQDFLGALSTIFGKKEKPLIRHWRPPQSGGQNIELLPDGR